MPPPKVVGIYPPDTVTVRLPTRSPVLHADDLGCSSVTGYRCPRERGLGPLSGGCRIPDPLDCAGSKEVYGPR
jgi:hypothetical protein